MDLLDMFFGAASQLSGAALTNYIISQVLGIGVFAICLVIGQVNGFKTILILKIIANVLQAASMIFVNAYTGATVAALAAVISVTVFVFRRKNVEIPKWFAPIAIAVYTVATAGSFSKPTDLLPIIGGVLLVLSLVSKTTTGFRIFMLISAVMWIPYDIAVLAHANLLTHVGNFITYAVGIIRFDLIKRKKDNGADI